MKVTTVVLNAAGNPHFETVDHLDIEELLRVARDREQMAREQGVEWTMGAVTFYGTELFSAVQTGEHHELDVAVTNMVMAACLFGLIYGGITGDQYRESHLNFVISESGAVSITRIPASSES